MTDVVTSDKDVIVEVQQPTVPAYVPPPKIGLVEINQVTQRGTAWITGEGPPSSPGGQYGDMYLDANTGDMYQWNGTGWEYVGTFAPSTLTPEEILAAMITVDGAGSALDADLLDGQHGAYYATASGLAAEKTRNDNQDATILANSTSINENAGSIADLQAEQTVQNNRMTTIEGVNTSQDAAINLKAPIASPTFTGDPKAPTPTAGDNDTSIATTAFVTAAVAAAGTGGPWAPIASPTFTGDPKAPTPSTSDNDTSIATTAFVKAQGYSTLQDAPNDGTQYVRQSLSWQPVVVPPGTYVADSPPASPAPNQLWWKSNLGQLFIYYLDPGGAPAQWVQAAGSATGQVRNTARSRNRVNNPTAQISQELGTALTGTNGAYPADQWCVIFSGIVVNAQKANYGVTPEGTTTGVNMVATTAKPSLAAGDYMFYSLPIEGLDLADLGWGTAAAKPVVLRFCANCTAPGTYGFSLGNSGSATRCFVGSFTFTTANTPQVFSFAIPGDTTGTWAKDTGVGMVIRFCAAAGSSSVGVAGWQANSFLVPPGCANAASVAGQNFYITDVGLYADPDNTGLPPPFVAPAYEDDLARCMRYWQLINIPPDFTMNLASCTNIIRGYSIPTMRVSGSGSQKTPPTNGYNPAGGSAALSTFVISSATTSSVAVQATSASALGGWTIGGSVVLSARLI